MPKAPPPINPPSIYRKGDTLHLGRVRIRAGRFPWQRRRSAAMLSSASERSSVGERYGWRGTDGMGRFGGGWNWEFGSQAGGKTILIMLLVGTLTISWYKPR